MKIGERIRIRRMQLGLSQGDLAAAVGYTSANKRSIVFQVEAGRNDVPATLLPAYAKALNTSIYYLLGMTDQSDWTDDHLLLIAGAHSDGGANSEHDDSL